MGGQQRPAAEFGIPFWIKNGLSGHSFSRRERTRLRMKTVSKNGLSGIIEVALIALMLVALGLMISLPWSITGVTDREPGMEGFFYEKYFVVLMFSGLMAELILWQARGIMHNVNVGRPFCRDTVRRLRTIGTECLVLAVAYFVGMFFVTKFFMVLIFVAFSVIGLILFVFAELFRQAIIYKEENEMTI